MCSSILAKSPTIDTEKKSSNGGNVQKYTNYSWINRLEFLIFLIVELTIGQPVRKWKNAKNDYKFHCKKLTNHVNGKKVLVY